MITLTPHRAALLSVIFAAVVTATVLALSGGSAQAGLERRCGNPFTEVTDHPTADLDLQFGGPGLQALVTDIETNPGPDQPIDMILDDATAPSRVIGHDIYGTGHNMLGVDGDLTGVAPGEHTVTVCWKYEDTWYRVMTTVNILDATTPTLVPDGRRCPSRSVMTSDNNTTIDIDFDHDEMTVRVENIPQNTGGDEPADLIWDANTDGELLATGTFGANETSIEIQGTIPGDAANGLHDLMICWHRNGQWYFRVGNVYLDRPVTTPTPVPGYASFGTGFRAYTAPSYSTPKPLPPSPDLRVLNMEVTQGVQCLDQSTGDTACADHSIPLVAGRIGWVRVWLQNAGSGGTVDNVSVKLTITRGPDTLVQYGNASTVPSLNRDDINSSVNFMFACPNCKTGDILTFRAEADPFNGISESNESNNLYPAGGTLNLTNYERRPLNIYAMSMLYETDDLLVYVPDDFMEGLDRQIRRAFPVQHWGNEVNYSLSLDWLRFRGPLDFVTQFSLLAVINNRFVVSGIFSAPDQVVVWVPSESGWDNGTSDGLWMGGMGVASGFDIGVLPYQDLSAGWTHEVAHNLGRKHPCTTSGTLEDPSWPYAGTGIRGRSYSIGETGIETSVATVNRFGGAEEILVPVAHSGSQVDIMQGGHCGFTMDNFAANRWFSPYSYQQLFCALSPNDATSTSCLQANAVPMGSTGGQAAGAAIASAAETVYIAGNLQASGEGAIQTVYRLGERDVNTAQDGQYCVELRAGDSTLQTGCFDANFEAGIDDGVLASASFGITLPWHASTDNMVLTRDGTVIGQVNVSANAPIVTVEEPSSGGPKSGEATVTWQASDADGDELEFTVLYSNDGGLNFIPIMEEPVGTSVTVDFSKLPGGGDAFFRVVASDKTGNTTTADSAHFSVANKPPRASILEPEGDMELPLGTGIVLMGSGSDPETLLGLEDTAYNWTSSLDGPLGDEATIMTDRLSPGLHTLTLTVTDPGGLTGTDTVEVFVGLPAFVDVQTGSPVTAHVELPYGYNAANVDTAWLRLKVGGVTLTPTDVEPGDVDNDGLPDFLLTFDTNAFRNALPDEGESADVMAFGELNDGTPFRGHDSVALVVFGDVNCDATVNSIDALQVLLATANLPNQANCLSAGDINCDGDTNSIDGLGILSAIARLPVNKPAECPDIAVASLTAADGAAGGLGRRSWRW